MMKLGRKPSIGDRRVVRRFALFPTVMRNRTRIWLESYTDHQVYSEYIEPPMTGWSSEYKEADDE